MRLHRIVAVAALLTLSAPVFATTPASGELTDASGPITFTGGPYILPTPGGIAAGSGVECEVPMTCDEYALTVTISDKFRMDARNAKEVAQITMEFAAPVAQATALVDLDLYLLSGTTVVGSSVGSFGVFETITVPLKVLKDGNYIVRIITGLPLGASAALEARIGRASKAGASELVITPAVAAPGEAVSLETKNLNAVGDYTYDFGDSSPAVASPDGRAMHTYADEGVYTAAVTYTAPGKGLASVSQPVVVESAASAISGVADKSSSNFGGAFGFPALFALSGLALLRRRRSGFFRAVLGATLSLFAASAQADGSGTLSDTAPALDYSGGMVLLPNLTTPTPSPLCPDAPSPVACDVYTLTVDLSDTFRAANSSLTVTMTFADADDWDVWMFDSSGAEIGRSADVANPETIALSLAQVPNGVYTFQMTPFFPTPDGFELNITADASKSGAAAGKQGSGLALGAFGFPLLFSLLGIALLRRNPLSF